MRTLGLLIAALTFMAGCGLSLYALYIPNAYRLGGASAIQVSQVYNMAVYYAVMAVAAFVATLVLAFVTRDSE